ncbi:hypothetical protein BD309DRAFT_951525 [Dichomitus squalens]|uniref:Uncharacterized protein n=1 Tax=Dichomitus squalens TaxID=114155 RepID=A0A4Q9PTJ3_9APHY|nr:hypothetical protein BD309DRAFT_951525 [Dichomitus squalens]TBU57776.1 hypothetical protein BD310DRAFT_928687 [Dichomitus squalens]
MPPRTRQYGEYIAIPETSQHRGTNRAEQSHISTDLPPDTPQARTRKRSSYSLEHAHDIPPPPLKRPRPSGSTAASLASRTTTRSARLSAAEATSNPPSSSPKSAARGRAAKGSKGPSSPLPKTRNKKNSAQTPSDEDVEHLKTEIPPALCPYLTPPRSDKGPVPTETRTFAAFLRWKTFYNDDLVERIIDERTVMCRLCKRNFDLCGTMVYDWQKWGQHRARHIRNTGPNQVPGEPVRLDRLLRGTCTRNLYYRNWAVWTLFVPRPTQSPANDALDSPRSSTASLAPPLSPLSRHSPVGPDKGPSTPIRVPTPQRFLRSSSSATPCPWSSDFPHTLFEAFPVLEDISGPELLLKAAEFIDHHDISCSCSMVLRRCM